MRRGLERIARGGLRQGDTLFGVFLLCGAVALFAGVRLFGPALLAVLAGTGVGFAFARPATGERAHPIPFEAPFFALFCLSEAAEGRQGSVLRAGIAAGLALVATLLGELLTPGRGRWDPRAMRFWPFATALLLGALALLSARTGGAGTMRPWFAGWLPPNVAEDAVFVLRKIVHSTFYPLLGYAALRAFEARRPGLPRPAVLPWAFAFTAVFAVFDEVRQAGIPGRGGAARDVFLDLGATLALFAWLRHGTLRHGTLRRKATGRAGYRSSSPSPSPPSSPSGSNGSPAPSSDSEA